MAKIIENLSGRNTIRLSVDDIINIVREYQNITRNAYSYEEIRYKLAECEIYLPEDLF